MLSSTTKGTMSTQCPKCNTKNPDDSKYCKECASPLKPSADVSVTKTIKTPAKGISKGIIIAGKYQIIQKLGEGGMGVVYKAKDKKLDRFVALKFLSSDLIKDKEAKKRFIQEAKAAAALEHPNICTVYEVDKTDGQTFIAMSYIEGQSLKDKFSEGPLDVDETKGIALQIAEGLKEAHEKGIVHRDIKPANIMLTKKGQAKITDFGLAKLSWGLDLTKTSTIMGTVAYMSPEQAKGEEVDQRTDIWSLGAIMYEMLSGERPFQKSQEQALIFAILNDKPTPLSLIRSDTPSHMEQVIEKALAKKVSDRYQDIQELIEGLKFSISLTKAEKSIVVLPFGNLSPDPEQEYFCDGMTEEIISDLSKIHTLRVISRTSAMMLKGTRKSMKTIGRDLDVEYVLEGSVRKAGNSLRITAQLIESTSDDHLWAEKYTGTLDDVFDIQEKVSRSIVDALKIKLSPEESQNIADRPIENVLAYEYYLKAKHEILRFTKEGFDHAMEHLQNGLKILGENTLLLRGIGFARFQQLNIGISSDRTLIAEIEDYARRILKWDSESPHGYFLYGCLGVLKGDFREAVKQWRRAYHIDPNDPDTMMFLGAHSCSTGQPEFARRLFKTLASIDPLVPFSQGLVYFADFYMGQLPEDLTSLKRIVKEAGTDNPLLMLCAIRIFAAAEEMEEATSIAEQLNDKHPMTLFSQASNALMFALQGKKEDALNQISKDLYNLVLHDCEWATVLIESYSIIGENEKALDLLEHSVDGGLINYPFLNEYDPFLENIRSEPRFKKLMERVKHEWENFEV